VLKVIGVNSSEYFAQCEEENQENVEYLYALIDENIYDEQLPKQGYPS